MAKVTFESMEIKMNLSSAIKSQIRSDVGSKEPKKLSGQCRLSKAGSKRNKEDVASGLRSGLRHRAYGCIQHSYSRDLDRKREICSAAILSDMTAVGEWEEEVSIFENIKHIEALVSILREADTYRQKV